MLSMKDRRGSVDKTPLVVCFGEMLIDFVPTVSGVSLAEAPSFKKAAGGAPANVAVCVAKLGGSSAFIGKVHFLSLTLCLLILLKYLFFLFFSRYCFCL